MYLHFFVHNGDKVVQISTLIVTWWILLLASKHLVWSLLVWWSWSLIPIRGIRIDWNSIQCANGHSRTVYAMCKVQCSDSIHTHFFGIVSIAYWNVETKYRFELSFFFYWSPLCGVWVGGVRFDIGRIRLPNLFGITLVHNRHHFFLWDFDGNTAWCMCNILLDIMIGPFVRLLDSILQRNHYLHWQSRHRLPAIPWPDMPDRLPLIMTVTRRNLTRKAVEISANGKQ